MSPTAGNTYNSVVFIYYVRFTQSQTQIDGIFLLSGQYAIFYIFFIFSMSLLWYNVKICRHFVKIYEDLLALRVNLTNRPQCLYGLKFTKFTLKRYDAYLKNIYYG